MKYVKVKRLEGVAVLSSPAAGPRLAYLGPSEARLAGQELTVRGAGRSLSAPARPAYAVLLVGEDDPVQRLLNGFAADLRRVSRELGARYRASRTSYLFTCLALVFSFFTAGMFFRVTRWPLANVLLAFLVLRCWLFLFRWLREGVAGELAKLAGAPRLASYLPEAALLALGALLLLVDLLFLPYDRWRGEQAGA